MWETQLLTGDHVIVEYQNSTEIENPASIHLFQITHDLKMYPLGETWIDQNLDSILVRHVHLWLGMPISTCINKLLTLQKIEEDLEFPVAYRGSLAPGAKMRIGAPPFGVSDWQAQRRFPSLFGEGVWGGALATNAFGSNREWMEPIVE